MNVAECSLADDIEKDRTVSGNFVSAITDIVSGLEELHQLEIYHRDLKPQNVLRFKKDDNSNDCFYAISDFGLTSMKESQLSALTKTGMQKTSDYYTAPEISNNLKLASPQSDIYSLGCILHDMVGTEERVPCNEIREPGPFSAILLGCTRKDPKNRFKSVGAVLAAILDLEFTPSAPTSQQSADFITTLDDPADPPPEFWEKLASYLEHDAAEADRAAICGRISTERVRLLCDSAPASASTIAIVFADWVGRSSFNFDHCDALANRLEAFFEKTNLEAKIDCLMALLRMGTSHNRWHVEHKFAKLCTPEMDLAVAKRLAIEFRIVGDEVCRKILHMEGSISFSRNSLHPALIKVLSEICV